MSILVQKLLLFCESWASYLPSLFNYNIDKFVHSPQLSGSVCAFHAAASGSNPKHTIYAFSICIAEIDYKPVQYSEKNKKRRDYLLLAKPVTHNRPIPKIYSILKLTKPFKKVYFSFCSIHVYCKKAKTTIMAVVYFISGHKKLNAFFNLDQPKEEEEEEDEVEWGKVHRLARVSDDERKKSKA